MSLQLDTRTEMSEPAEVTIKADGSHLSEPEPADAPVFLKPSKKAEPTPEPPEAEVEPDAEVATDEKVEEKKPEPVAEVEKEEKPDTKKEESERAQQLAKGFAKLAKEEAKLRAREQHARATMEQFRAAQQQLESEREQRRSLEAEYRKNPQKLIHDFGFTLEAVNKFVLNKGKLDPSDEVAQMRAELERERAAQREQEQRRQREQEEYQRRASEQERTYAHQQALDAVTRIGQQSAEQFPLLSRAFNKSPVYAASLAEQAVAMFENHYNQHGRTLDINTIFGHIENELAGFADLYTSNSNQAQVQPPSPPAQSKPGTKAPPVKKSPSTLTNDIAHDRVGKKQLTPEEEFKLADEEALKMPIWKKHT